MQILRIFNKKYQNTGKEEVRETERKMREEERGKREREKLGERERERKNLNRNC